jgi:hypothetical protein
MIDPRYLGDGVYASYDGYHIWLAANHHENKVVALEPEVFRALVEYARYISTVDPDAGETIDDDPLPPRAELFKRFGLEPPKRHRITIDGKEYLVSEDGTKKPIK